MPNTIQSTKPLLQGAQEIERAVNQRLRELGGDPALNFRWQRGKPLDPIPSRFQWHPDRLMPPAATGAIELEVVGHNGNRSNAILSREQLQDSWNCVDRPDVVHIVEDIAHDLTRSRTN